jgi:hypothetical protein
MVNTVTFGYRALSRTSVAWRWLLPLVVPFLTLIVTSVAAEAHRHNPSTAQTNDLAFGLALWMSVVLVAIVGSLLAVLWAAEPKPLDILKTSNLWLTPIQGLIGIAMGVFFTQRRRSASSAGWSAERAGQLRDRKWPIRQQ